MTPQERKSLIEQIARKTVAKDVAWPNLHKACAESPRCLATGYTEIGEDGWDRFFGEFNAAIRSGGEMTDEMADEISDEASELYQAAFAAEWRAKVKPCK